MSDSKKNPNRLRSEEWFNNPAHPDGSVIYIERFLNYGITPEELRAGKPIIGIAQVGSDIAPCNRGHIETEERVKAGIRDAGGIPFVFPVHPIQESCRRPAAALDRNLAYLGIVEVLHGYPFDGVVLTTGCDKTTPACLMAAATMNLPAIVHSGGPMLDGWYNGELAGSGMMVWEGNKLDFSSKPFINNSVSSNLTSPCPEPLKSSGFIVTPCCPPMNSPSGDLGSH